MVQPLVGVVVPEVEKRPWLLVSATDCLGQGSASHYMIEVGSMGH